MKEKNLRITIYAVGLICLLAFFAIRSFPLMNALLSEKMNKESRDFTKYGELYYYSCIKDFRVEFGNKYGKYRLSDRNPRITEADILTYGDSFFDLSFQKNIPELLSDSLDKKVFSYVSTDPYRSDPFCIINEAGIKNNFSPKQFIYETVERNIAQKFLNPFNSNCSNNSTYKESIKKKIKVFVFKENSEKLYSILLQQSILTSKFYSLISSVKFKLFGYISSLTSIYTTRPEPWLFYEKEYTHELGGYYYQYTDKEIQNYADNILYLKNRLKSLYNFDLLFLPVPTKYTVYHKLVNNHPYNNFLPRLYKELDKRGINYIDLYIVYSKSDEILYHGTDTHWNSKGVDMALKLVLERINYNASSTLSPDYFSESNIPNNKLKK
jgi:hypothetical protein